LDDVGLTQTLDESHGKAGADICRKFINSDKLNLTTDFSSALEAIEKHDDKKYIKTETFEDKPTILTILSTADDLDAFGNIGIIRYAEIYMLRNTSIEEISDKVIKNAEQRLQHFSNKFGYFKELVDQQKKRYEELVNFYKSVNASTNQHRNILLHIQNNIKSPQNNKNLTDLLAPVDSQHIKDFKSKVEQEEQQFLEYSQIGFL